VPAADSNDECLSARQHSVRQSPLANALSGVGALPRKLPAERCHHGLLLGLHCVYLVAHDQGQQLQYQPDHPEKGLDLAKAEYKGFNHINRFPSPRLSDKREPSGS